MTGQPDALRDCTCDVEHYNGTHADDCPNEPHDPEADERIDLRDRQAYKQGGDDTRAHLAAVLADEATVEVLNQAVTRMIDDFVCRRSDVSPTNEAVIATALAALLPILTGASDDVPRVLQ